MKSSVTVHLISFIGVVLSPVWAQQYDFAAEISRQCLVPDPVGLLDCVESRVDLPYMASWVECTNSLGQNVATTADIINYRCKSVWEGKGVIPEVFYIKDCVIEKIGLPAPNVSKIILGSYKECESSSSPTNPDTKRNTSPAVSNSVSTQKQPQPSVAKPPSSKQYFGIFSTANSPMFGQKVDQPIVQQQMQQFEQNLQQSVNQGQFGQRIVHPKPGMQQPAQQFSQQPLNQQFSQQPLIEQLVQQPFNQQFRQQPVNQQFGQQPLNHQFVQQPLNQQFGQQPFNQQFGQQPSNQHFGQQPFNQQFIQQNPFHPQFVPQSAYQQQQYHPQVINQQPVGVQFYHQPTPSSAYTIPLQMSPNAKIYANKQSRGTYYESSSLHPSKTNFG